MIDEPASQANHAERDVTDSRRRHRSRERRNDPPSTLPGRGDGGTGGRSCIPHTQRGTSPTWLLVPAWRHRSACHGW